MISQEEESFLVVKINLGEMLKTDGRVTGPPSMHID